MLRGWTRMKHGRWPSPADLQLRPMLHHQTVEREPAHQGPAHQALWRVSEVAGDLRFRHASGSWWTRLGDMI